MSITKKEALQYSVNLWFWYSNNLGSDYTQFPEYSHKYTACALCEYDGQSEDSDGCTHCPMFGMWPTATGYTEECDENDDAYSELYNKKLITYDKCFFALVILEAFQQQLDKEI